MEVTDQYSPAKPFSGNDFEGESRWETFRAAEDESTNGHDESAAVSMSPVLFHEDSAVSAVVAIPTPNRSRQLAQELAGTLQELSEALSESESEREDMLSQQAGLEEQIRGLESHRAEKDRFTQTLTEGSGGSLSTGDLESIEGVLESLKKDPDRLTILFSVVQHAEQLASIVSDYTQLRRLADGA